MTDLRRPDGGDADRTADSLAEIARRRLLRFGQLPTVSVYPGTLAELSAALAAAGRYRLSGPGPKTGRTEVLVDMGGTGPGEAHVTVAIGCEVRESGGVCLLGWGCGDGGRGTGEERQRRVYSESRPPSPSPRPRGEP